MAYIWLIRGSKWIIWDPNCYAPMDHYCAHWGITIWALNDWFRPPYLSNVCHGMAVCDPKNTLVQHHIKTNSLVQWNWWKSVSVGSIKLMKKLKYWMSFKQKKQHSCFLGLKVYMISKNSNNFTKIETYKVAIVFAKDTSMTWQSYFQD